jgi:preprotein translocase subunit SecD
MNKILSGRTICLLIISLVSLSCLLKTVCLAETQDPVKPSLVAVVDFENETGSSANAALVKAMTDSVIASFVKSGAIQVVERSRIAKLLEEQKLVLSGLIDTDRVANIGKLLAAEHIVIGSLSSVGNSWMVTMRLLEVKTGRILLAEMFQVEDQSAVLTKTRDTAGIFLKKISQGVKGNYLMTFIVSPKGKGKKKLTVAEEKKLTEILKKKVVNFGSSVGRIALRGNKVEVLIRGVSEPLELAGALMSDDILQFRIVDDRFDPSTTTPPMGSELLSFKDNGSKGYIAVRNKVELTGDHIEIASISLEQWNRPVIMLHFDPVGKSLFARITRNNIEKRLAVILNGKVLIAPRILMEIRDGKAQITGNFTMDEAFRISVNLRSGSLPANLSLAGMEKEP